MSMRAASLFLLGSTVLACAAPSDDAEPDVGEDAAELASRPCDWAQSCPDAIQVARARDYYPDRPPARLRQDIAVTTTTWEKTPRVFMQRTTRPLRYDGGERMMLGGDAAGTKDFAIDNILLVEVLAGDGSLLDAAYVGAMDPATLGGAPLRRIGPDAPYVGLHQGVVLGANAVDLSSLLPKNRVFRLRFSALDNGGEALVTDVWIRKSAPAADPFDPASCDGAPLTRSEALARFAPAATVADLGSVTVATRVRSCNATTGCADWSATDQIPYVHFWHDDRGYLQDDWRYLAMPAGSYESRARLVVEAKGAIRLDVGARVGTTGFVVNEGAPGEHPLSFAMEPTFVGTCNDVFCTNAYRVYNDGLAHLTKSRTVTAHCLRIGGSTKIDAGNGNSSEYETVIVGRY